MRATRNRRGAGNNLATFGLVIARAAVRTRFERALSDEAGPVPSRTNVYRTALAYRDLRLLIVAFAQSQLGDFLYTVALIVYVFDATRSPAWIAALTVLRALPWVILQPFAGAIADRYDRR